MPLPAPVPPKPMSFAKKILLSLLRILVGVPAVSLLAGGSVLFVLGTTWVGRSVGLSVAVLGGVLYCSIGYWNREWFQRIRRRFYAVLLPICLLLYLIPAMLAPSGNTVDGRVRNCFLHGKAGSSRYSPANIIPEVDQIAAGVNLARFRGMGTREATRLRSLVLPIYEEMDNDADFHALGSAMGAGYRELVGLDYHTGHYYLFLPDATNGTRLPCLIFLHGLGGNTKACLWVLSRQTRCAVIAPTFGMGNWDKPEGADFVVNVAREALAKYPLDAERVYLMGYSNGGMGVTRAAAKAPELFKGLIYLSPVTEDDLFSTAGFSSRKDRKILFLQGGRDERIPCSVVQGTARSLKQLGFDVRLKVYDDEDHYLLFSQQEAVLGEIMEWMAQQ
jgi:predicted esterase